MKFVLNLCLSFCLVLALSCGASEEKEKKLIIGSEGAYMPWNGLDASGNLIGFEIDLANEICKKINRKCEFIKQDWDGIIPALLNRKYDVIMAGMTITDERRKKIDFSNPYADTGTAIASINMEKINSLNDVKDALKDKTIGVQTGTISAQFIQKEYGDTEIANVRVFNTQEEMNLDLIAGRIDAAMNDTSVWIELQKEKPEVKVISPIFNGQFSSVFGEGIGVGILKDRTELLNEINQAIKDLKAQGITGQLSQKWFGFDASL